MSRALAMIQPFGERAKLVGYAAGRKAAGAVSHHFAQAAAEIQGVFPACGERQPAGENRGPTAVFQVEPTLLGELAVGLGDGVEVNAQFHSQPADGGKNITGREPALY